MLHQAKNGTVRAGGADMDYIRFGTGPGTLVMLPGLGDGLATVRGKALPMAAAYRLYARAYTVYVFSRKDRLEEGATTRDMARDQAEALRELGLGRADVLGVSQGGMVAQYLAIDSPALVRRLVLAVTPAGQSETLQAAVRAWIGYAQRGDYRGLLADTAERSYSAGYLKKARLLYPLLGAVGRPESFGRFLIQAASCLGHDAAAELGRIACPTLVIGGGEDRVLGPEAAPALAAAIPGSRLYVYEGLGHAAYEEAGDFHRRVLDFLQG